MTWLYNGLAFRVKREVPTILNQHNGDFTSRWTAEAKPVSGYESKTFWAHAVQGFALELDSNHCERLGFHGIVPELVSILAESGHLPYRAGAIEAASATRFA